MNDIATIKQKYIYKLYTDAPRVGVSFFLYMCKEFNAELVILVSFALDIIQYVIIVISIVMYCFVV